MLLSEHTKSTIEDINTSNIIIIIINNNISAVNKIPTVVTGL
jgi:hypothetical protein